MKSYTFEGKIRLGDETQPFKREIKAQSTKHAKDKLYSELGSEHSVSRSKIKLEETEEGDE